MIGPAGFMRAPNTHEGRRKEAQSDVQPIVMPLSAADRDALSRMPDGWFYPDMLSYMIRRPFWRCSRLEDLGVLESRVEGPIYNLQRQYRKIEA